MQAILFEVENSFGVQAYILTGENAAAIWEKFRRVQSLAYFWDEGKYFFAKAETPVAKKACYLQRKAYFEQLTLEDFRDFAVICNGSIIKAKAFAATDAELKALRAKHPLATVK